MTRARDNANLSPTIPDARMPNLTGDVTTSEGAVATTIATDAVDIAMLSATGTASSSTFLRGDNTWVTPTDTNTVTALDPVVGDFDYGQTWTDYSPTSAGAGDGGRAVGSTYTNDTGKPIFVYIGLYATASSTHVSIEINEDTVGSGYIGAIYHRNLMMFYVPDDATYSCPSAEAYDMHIWHEFR